MKRWIIILIFAVVLPIAAWIVLRLTGMLQFYVVPTAGNMPTIKPGQLVFTSNIVTPERNDLVAYDVKSPSLGTERHIFRLVGLPGDTVLIKRDTLFVNGKDADAGLNLCHVYISPKEIADAYSWPKPRSKAEQYAQLGQRRWMGTDSALLLLESVKHHDWILRSRKLPGYVISESFQIPFELQDWDHPEWTTHDFGPVVVPVGKWFFMGDNRDQCLDSRYLGFVDQQDFRGTRVW